MAAQLNLNTEKIEKIKTQVQGINDTALAQASTIAEIAALLEGKSVPGGDGSESIETAGISFDYASATVLGRIYYMGKTGTVETAIIDDKPANI